MFGKLRELLGIAPQQQPVETNQATRMAQPMRMKVPPSQYAQRASELSRMPKMSPAQAQYPGRTNYGVPEDNMIDTEMGYLTDDQFNQGIRGVQAQAYPVQRLYGGMAGIPSNARRGVYLQSGGVPTITRNNGPMGVAEDANGQEALRRIVTQNLMVR